MPNKESQPSGDQSPKQRNSTESNDEPIVIIKVPPPNSILVLGDRVVDYLTVSQSQSNSSQQLPATELGERAVVLALAGGVLFLARMLRAAFEHLLDKPTRIIADNLEGSLTISSDLEPISLTPPDDPRSPPRQPSLEVKNESKEPVVVFIGTQGAPTLIRLPGPASLSGSLDTDAVVSSTSPSGFVFAPTGHTHHTHSQNMARYSISLTISKSPFDFDAISYNNGQGECFNWISTNQVRTSALPLVTRELTAPATSRDDVQYILPVPLSGKGRVLVHHAAGVLANAAFQDVAIALPDDQILYVSSCFLKGNVNAVCEGGVTATCDATITRSTELHLPRPSPTVLSYLEGFELVMGSPTDVANAAWELQLLKPTHANQDWPQVKSPVFRVTTVRPHYDIPRDARRLTRMLPPEAVLPKNGKNSAAALDERWNQLSNKLFPTTRITSTGDVHPCRDTNSNLELLEPVSKHWG